MLFKNITILDENMEIKTDMYVAVDKDKIKYIGKNKPEGQFGKMCIRDRHRSRARCRQKRKFDRLCHRRGT